ncbi:hypothetical protein GGI12_002738 [Dipsacomyces acuminosporus]|nr:hypothetical protein GGI12_002738 [Dipsacomyces acuminosporus]
MEVRINGEHVARIAGSDRFVLGIDSIVASKAEHFVRHVVLDVPLGHILEGRATKALLGESFAESVFPSAFHLQCNIHDTGEPEEQVQQEELKSNALGFCKRVKQLFPSLDSLYVHANRASSRERFSLMGFTIANLTSPDLSALIYDGHENYLYNQEFGYLGNLTHLALVEGTLSSDMVEIMHHSAPSLKHVNLITWNSADFANLATGSDGSTIIYPRLKKLMLAGFDSDLGTLASPAGTPFPALTHLEYKGEYIFDNDALFRGNAGTLEYLRLEISSNLAKALIAYNILVPDNYPALRCVILSEYPFFEMDEELARCVARFPFEFGAQVQKIRTVFHYGLPSRIITNAIRSLTEPQFIRELDISRFELELCEVIEAIKRLPFLNHFTFEMSSGEDSEGETQMLSLLPELHKEHFPLSSRLFTLSFVLCPYEQPNQTLADYLMIASLIPSLKEVKGQWSEDESSDSIWQILSDPAFKPYAEHLLTLRY